MSDIRIEAPNVCPNNETGHLIKIGPGTLECLSCKVNRDKEGEQ